MSGVDNGAKRAKTLVSGSGAVSRTCKNRAKRERSVEQEVRERERSGERKSNKTGGKWGSILARCRSTQMLCCMQAHAATAKDFAAAAVLK